MCADPHPLAGQPATLVQALTRIKPSVLSVSLVEWLATRFDARPNQAPSLRARLLTIAIVAGSALLLDSVLRAFDRGSHYPTIAWLGVYAAFAAYLMISSSVIWAKLFQIAPSLDSLLGSPDSRRDVAAWIEKVSSRRLQLSLSILAATVSAVAMGLVDHHYTSLRISWAWYFATWLTIFFAFDAVSWAFRVVLLTRRLGRQRHLTVSTFAPVQTPAIRDLRSLAASVAVVTGLGLFFFVTPFAWAVAYVLGHHESAATLRLLSIPPVALTALTAVTVVFAPQFFIAAFVGRERDALLDRLDEEISKDPDALLDPPMERRVALFNSIAATRTTVFDTSALLKRATGLLAPLIPIVVALLANILGFAPARKPAPPSPTSACTVCEAPTPSPSLIPAAITPTPTIPTSPSDPESVAANPTPPIIAELAKRYQPILNVSVFDRFWPVSVAVILRERENGRYTCLVDPERTCGTSTAAVPLAKLRSDGSSDAYLDYPEPLNRVRSQFVAFVGALGFNGASAAYLWDHPQAMDPYPWAQIYFYYTDRMYHYPPAPAGLISLQYWFFYPLNYYPTWVSDRRAMLVDPTSISFKSTDYHEGDWEHVTVLLDRETLTPSWLWTARHSDEGTAIPWGDVTREEGHPVVYGALGGHPSYAHGCEAWRRGGHRIFFKMVHFFDYTGCAPNLFSFTADGTRLVDLRAVSWACWPGNFGKAGSSLVAANNFDDPTGLYLVAGPRSPLRQAENADAHACSHR